MAKARGWLAALLCLLASSHGRAPDSLASPTDPCMVANDPLCHAFTTDPCGGMDLSKYSQFVQASDGTKASFFRRVDAETKGYISAPRDFYNCGKASHADAAQCRAKLSPAGAGFTNGTSRLGCYGDSVTYEICRRGQLLLSGMPGPDGQVRPREKKQSRFFRQDWIDPPPASHRQSHGFGCSTETPKRRRDVVVEWELIESMFQSPGVAVVMVGMDNLHCLLRDNVRYGENVTTHTRPTTLHHNPQHPSPPNTPLLPPPPHTPANVRRH